MNLNMDKHKENVLRKNPSYPYYMVNLVWLLISVHDSRQLIQIPAGSISRAKMSNRNTEVIIFWNGFGIQND